MLKVGSDLVPAAQVEQERQRVNVRRSAQKHGQLGNTGRSRTQLNLKWSSVGQLGRRTITASWEILSHLIWLWMCLLALLFSCCLKHQEELCKMLLVYECKINISSQSSRKALREGYKGSDNEQRVEDVWLEGEQSQTHVGEDEVFCQEIQQLEQLKGRRHTFD